MAVAVTVVAFTVMAANAVYGKPGNVSVRAIGCTTARVTASGFSDGVDTVDWSIAVSGQSSAKRSGTLVLGSDGSASTTVQPDLGSGSYQLTWSHEWRGQALREGVIGFTIPSCSSPDPTTSAPTDPATSSASPSDTLSGSPTASDASTGEVLPTSSPTSSSYPTEWGSAGGRRVTPVSSGGANMGQVASLALVTLGSAMMAVIVWRRRRVFPRHRRPGWWD